MGEWGQVSHFNIFGISGRVRLHFTTDSLSILALGPHEFVIQLEPQPEARRGSEVAAQAQVVFRRAAAAAFFHVRQMGGGNPRHSRDFRLRDAPFFQGFAERFCEEIHQRDQLGGSFHGLNGSR